MNARTSGYTLIEALCAFAILAATLVALFGVGGTTLRLSGQADQLERASLLAESKLDELTSTQAVLPRREDGEFPGTTIRWHMEVTAVGPPGSSQEGSHLQEVRLKLSWQDTNRAKSLTFTTRHLGWGSE